MDRFVTAALPMIRSRLDRLLRGVLLAAFLAGPGTPLHAHLHAPHEHGGDSHAHAAVHAHQRGAVHAGATHAESIDSAHADAPDHAAPAGEVGLAPDASCGKRCQPGDTPAAPAAAGDELPAGAAAAVVLPAPQRTRPGTRPPHPGQPRAPPRA